jgi:hypothetical protein
MRKMVKSRAGKETQHMADVHATVKFSQRAFNQGVSDLITLRPLRDALAGVAHGRSKPRAVVVSTDIHDRGSNISVLKRDDKKTSGRK